MIEIIRNTLMITSFVLVMMLLIEYLTVLTRGKWSLPIQKSGVVQILLAAVLGIIPGCMGTYVAVTLYAHGIFSFAALITAMIATVGDEAFVMLSVMPDTALTLFLILFITSVVSGYIIYLFIKNKNFIRQHDLQNSFHDQEPHCHCFEKKSIIPQLKNITFERAILIFGLLLYLIGSITGQFEHDHENLLFHGMVDSEHEQHHGIDWIAISGLFSSLFGLFIVITSPNHFLHHHLWEHIIKRHLYKIFLWTFGALLFIHYGLEFLDIENWLKDNYWIILVIALLVGIIPESGPHILFITLYLNSTIPLSILLANSIVQDGHGAIPLLAESKKTFVYIKLVKLLIGLLAGIAGYIAGF